MNSKLFKRSHFSQDFTLDGGGFDDALGSLNCLIFDVRLMSFRN